MVAIDNVLFADITKATWVYDMRANTLPISRLPLAMTRIATAIARIKASKALALLHP